MLHRLKEYIDYKGISTARFEKSIGMSNASFGKSLKNNGTIGADKLEIILSVYTDLDLYWLVTGKGQMLKGYVEEISPGGLNDKPPNYKSAQVYEKRIRTQEETIETLQHYIHVLEEKQIKNKTKNKEPGDPGQKRKAG